MKKEEQKAIRESIAEQVGPELYHKIRLVEDLVKSDVEWISNVELRKPGYSPVGENGLVSSQELISNRADRELVKSVAEHSKADLGRELLKQDLSKFNSHKLVISPRKGDLEVLKMHFIVVKDR